jgi:hypothetical protein
MEEYMEFKEINTAGMLVDYLIEKGITHRNYHHYTNINSALAIIKSGYWHLSLGDRMNDKQELTKGDMERWKNIFITSFAFGESENIAIWGLYSLPWEDAVRITIPNRAMCSWIQRKPTIYGITDDDSYNYVPINPSSVELKLTDVAYISDVRGTGNGTIKWYDKRISLKDNPNLRYISNNPIITGYIKNDAWSYENEVRIHAQFNNYSGYKKIAIKIPDDVINSIEIKAGPWMKDDIKTRIEQELKKTTGEKLQIRHSYSSFLDLVELRSVCNYCLHGAFKNALG